MPKRGRPSKEGKKDPIALVRAMIALCAYGQARQTRTKYDSAVEFAVEAVQRTLPGIAVSRTEIKRALAAFRPRGEEEILLVAMECPGTWTFKFGPRPNDRVNRRD